MRVLLDECLPKDFARELPGHAIKTVPQAGWASLKNGKLLRLIADSGKFEAFLKVDKNLPRQAVASGTVSTIGRICCRELKESVSSASIEEPVIVPAIERWISQLAGQDRAVLPYRHESESCRGG